MHGSKVPLRTWFLAAHLLATHSNGMSALQLQAKLGLGSYKTAWLLLHKLRRAMVDPGRTPLSGDVEVDETVIPFRTKDDPPAGGHGRSPIGKIVVIGAVELLGGNRPGRIRLEVIPDYRGDTLKGFIERNVQPGSHIWTDDNKSYYGLRGYKHTPRVIGKMAAHVIMPWIHRAFSNMKRWAMGVFHGFRKKYLNAYLNEYVFRWNRRRSYRSAFERLVGIGVALAPATCNDIRATAA
jgi:transposase-like protein